MRHKENVKQSITILRKEADSCYNKAKLQTGTSKQMVSDK